MPMFQRSPSLVEQVKSYLKKQIATGAFEEGRIPAEVELARTLNVSRNTVRDALSRLEIEGTIFRRQGAGTFVNQAGLMVKSQLSEIVPYQLLIEEYGCTSSIELVSVEEITHPPTAKKLHLDKYEPLLFVKKRFLADNQPVIFSCTYLPTHFIQQSYSPEDLRLPVFDFIPRFCEHEFAYYLTELVPIIPADWLVSALQLPAQKKALVSFEELGYNQNNVPIVIATSYFRDDLLRLRLIRQNSQ
jgi:GntR family transcriptional regulator